MTILTIDSVCSDARREFRKLLMTKRRIIPCSPEPNYNDVSSVLSSVSTFSKSVKEDGNIYIFPISLVFLSRFEGYDLVMELLKALHLDEHEQIAICIDGNVNDALAEMFEHDSKCLLTLDDLRENRSIITGESPNSKHIFSKNHRIINTMIDKLVFAEQDIFPHPWK
jgi:hypothetical protein